MSKPFIQFQGVEKSFRDNHVLRGLDLVVHAGETLVILGGSGSGKSVLLRHSIGLHRPDAGRVFVDGEDITDFDESELFAVRKKVGMLFQNGALFDSMTVEDNVAFALNEHTDWPDEKIRERVQQVLAFVELENVEHLEPSSLSGGMRKRVALARAIALAPQAILYDEPTTGLDPITSNTINHLIRGLQKRLGVTSIVVTHDLHSAFMVGDRLAFLHEGQTYFHGTIEEARNTDVPLLRNFLSGGGYAEASR